MVREILISFFICMALLTFTWYLKSLLLRPLKPGNNIGIHISIRARGSAPELENTVRTLVWLSVNGTIPADIEIVDLGMDEDTLAAAYALAGDNNIELRRIPDGRETA